MTIEATALAAADQPLIEIIDMYKIYDMGAEQVHALDGVSLTVYPHEFVAIAGPSGSGKSTLMHMIGCLDTPTSGTYRLDGIDVSSLSDRKLTYLRRTKIGFVFQQFNLLAKSSALENVELPAMYRGVGLRERRRQSQEALRRVGLEDRFRYKPAELSGGQQQRVAIARAMVNNPPILLADEPTGNLDSRSGKEILEMFRGLHDQGSTVILITHDRELADLADRIITIYDGKITSDTRKEGGTVA
jgi:putative ABC transport system ATP-binding protein